jgi:hypothetical protein
MTSFRGLVRELQGWLRHVCPRFRSGGRRRLRRRRQVTISLAAAWKIFRHYGLRRSAGSVMRGLRVESVFRQGPDRCDARVIWL